jgi:hypothetical protein
MSFALTNGGTWSDLAFARRPKCGRGRVSSRTGRKIKLCAVRRMNLRVKRPNIITTPAQVTRIDVIGSVVSGPKYPNVGVNGFMDSLREIDNQ